MAKINERFRTKRSRGANNSSRWLWIAVATVAAVVAISVYVLRQDDSPGAAGAPANDPGVVHVHGLGVNPANGDVYAATHMGVFQVTDDGEARRIADRYQDTMGFTVVGPDHFLASGHPDLREKLPPLLGLLESRDAGRTWEKKSLLGKADFHALRYAHNTIYGYDSTGGGFMVSRDGVRWETRSTMVLRDFAVSPNNPDAILATTPSDLKRSTDGGRTWKKTEGPSRPVYVAWDANDRLWLLDDKGRLHTSDGSGLRWEARRRALGTPEALLATGGKLYAAAAGAILVSTDQGRSWQPFYREGSH